MFTQGWRRLGHSITLQIRHTSTSSKSALFVSGRNAVSQFAVFSPDTEFAWVKDNREVLDMVYKERESAVHIEKLIAELDLYSDIKKEVEKQTHSRNIINQQIKESKTKGGNLNVVLLNRLKENKKALKQQKEILWDIEENLVPALLKLQNCDFDSTFEEKLYFTQSKQPTGTLMKKGHKELAAINDLVEFSDNSHTAFYLKHDLARLELLLSKYISSILLDQDLEIFSNPDFSKSVVVEGCGKDFLDSDQIFSLKQYQDFGERTSCNAMHLSGGASLIPFVAYFARNILLNPHILPMNAFCLGRTYSPQPEASSDLFRTQQSQGVQLFSLSGTKEDMEEQLKLLLDCFVEILRVLPNFTITEQKLADCEHWNSRQFRVTMRGAQTVEVGHVAVQGNYFSKRVMMAGQGAGSNNFQPLYTASAHLNITRMLGVLVEMAQDQEGRVEFNKIAEWLQ